MVIRLGGTPSKAFPSFGGPEQQNREEKKNAKRSLAAPKILSGI
jgi:hypothetical protein